MTHSFVAVLHTSPATVDLFGRMISEAAPGVRIMNILDDSILPELGANGGDVSAVLPRWRGYAENAKAQGATLILNACSSIGELCTPVAAEIGVPIQRVDSALAREAIARGPRIAVLATLPTTLRPTGDLIAETAKAEGKAIALSTRVIEGAYSALMQGDQQRHDDLLVAAMQDAGAASDVIVLAQASMARVTPRLAPELAARCLTSPPLAVAEFARRISG